MARPLHGRRALVTGASGGTGAAIARRLAEAGADLVLTFANHRDGADAAAADINGVGRRAAVLHADLAQPNAGRSLIEQVLAELGAIDVLVANAGAGEQRSWDEVDDAVWDHAFAVNVNATWQMTRAVLPSMIEKEFGRILYVSSLAALNGGLVGPHYAASKATLHGLTHHMAPRVARHGITVNTVAPALIGGTRMLPASGGGPDDSTPTIPVGYLGEPEDVAQLAIAMLTNRYLTNKLVVLDGGIHPT